MKASYVNIGGRVVSLNVPRRVRVACPWCGWLTLHKSYCPSCGHSLTRPRESCNCPVCDMFGPVAAIALHDGTGAVRFVRRDGKLSVRLNWPRIVVGLLAIVITAACGWALWGAL